MVRNWQKLIVNKTASWWLYFCFHWLIHFWLKKHCQREFHRKHANWMCTDRHMHRPKSRVLFSHFFVSDEKHMCQWDFIELRCMRCALSWNKPNGEGKGSTICMRVVCVCVFDRNCNCAEICNGNMRKWNRSSKQQQHHRINTLEWNKWFFSFSFFSCSLSLYLFGGVCAVEHYK